FLDWDTISLVKLLAIATKSGRCYGDPTELSNQHEELKKRFIEQNFPNQMKESDKWLRVCKRKNIYAGCEKIIHFALCCFVKAPLEATAESVGSVINQHGRKDRYSLLARSLADEVQVAWNGPVEFSKEANAICEEAVEKYFEKSQYGIRFYVADSLKLMSSDIKAVLTSRSRIYF
ncbi:unnamed protein product, partial [Meganyctiphanes norvegica]